MSTRPIVHHIPVCPFCQRLEILLSLKDNQDAVAFSVVDITQPRDPVLLAKTRGTTALPVLELPDGKILKESLVILDYLDETVPGGVQRRSDPYEHAVERMLIAKEAAFTEAGYRYVMNTDLDQRDDHRQTMLRLYSELDDFLVAHNPDGVFLFDDFGIAEAVFTPLFMRFWFLEYYEGFELPKSKEFARVRRWRDACLLHPAAQQVQFDQIVKLYYDYALGAGNGALLPQRSKSSFVLTPHWRERPMPPADKYRSSATDAELGLVPSA